MLPAALSPLARAAAPRHSQKRPAPCFLPEANASAGGAARPSGEPRLRDRRRSDPGRSAEALRREFAIDGASSLLERSGGAPTENPASDDTYDSDSDPERSDPYAPAPAPAHAPAPAPARAPARVPAHAPAPAPVYRPSDKDLISIALLAANQSQSEMADLVAGAFDSGSFLHVPAMRGHYSRGEDCHHGDACRYRTPSVPSSLACPGGRLAYEVATAVRVAILPGVIRAARLCFLRHALRLCLARGLDLLDLAGRPEVRRALRDTGAAARVAATAAARVGARLLAPTLAGLPEMGAQRACDTLRLALARELDLLLG